MLVRGGAWCRAVCTGRGVWISGVVGGVEGVGWGVVVAGGLGGLGFPWGGSAFGAGRKWVESQAAGVEAYVGAGAVAPRARASVEISADGLGGGL